MTFLHFLTLAVGLAHRRPQLSSIRAVFWHPCLCDVGQCVSLDSNFILKLGCSTFCITCPQGVASMWSRCLPRRLGNCPQAVSTCMFTAFFKASLLLRFYNCTCCELTPLKSLLFTTPIACAFRFITTGRAVACLL